MMLSLFSEVHFWTLRDEIGISNSDFGAFRYYDKKSHEESISYEGKKLYAEKRGYVWVPQNKRPIRLKESLKELEEHMSQQRIVLCQWRDFNHLQLMFSSGLFVNIVVNAFSGDPLSITFDKFLIGKLLSDYVSDVVLTKSHLICSYNDGQLTLVYFAKPTLKRSSPKSFSRLDPRIQTVDLAGPAGRRLERKLACNVSGDMVVVWWHSSHDEVYPWSPIVKDQDRANMLVYGISGLKADLLCHHRSEFDLLSVSFSQVHSNVLRSVEQKVSRNGDVTVESSSYQITRGSMQKSSAASIALPTHVCCHSFSPLQDKLLMGCIDGSLVLYDEALGVTHVVKAAFIPSLVSWHPDGGVFVVANERCKLQILDVSLATLKQQLVSEDATPGNLLDATSYFRIQPTLRNVKWNLKAETNFYAEKFAIDDCLLLLLFERGPLAALRFVGGGGLFRDIHGSGGFTVDSLVAQYLWANQVDRAINLLLTLNWDLAGSICLSCLQRIVNHLFKQPLTPDQEVQIQTVLGCFHTPVRPMCPATIEEFKAPVRDLTRRFFHHLLRYKLFEKAFRLAIDLMDCDLFMDIHFSAKRSGKTDIANAALKKVEEFDSSSYISSPSASSHSKCSKSSCSDCSESTSIVSESDGLEHDDRSPLDSGKPLRVAEKNGNGKFPHIPFPAENGSNHSHPSLPMLANINIPAVPGNMNVQCDMNSTITLDEPGTWETWEKPRAGVSGNGTTGIFFNCTKDFPEFVNGKLAASSQSLRAQSIQNGRPKVKFCETVTQITLPDHLHTLTEEEEDFQSRPQILPSNDPDVKTSSRCFKSPNSPSLKPPQSTLSSFNSVGIPIVHSASSRLGVHDRRNLEINDLPLPTYLTSRGAFHNPSSSLTNPPFKWMAGPGTNFGKQPLSQSIHQVPLPTMSSFESAIGPEVGCSEKSHSVLEKFGYNVNKEMQGDVYVRDLLSSEELSALLPGSRKPLASGMNSFDRSLHSSSIANGSSNRASIENANQTNFSNAVHDLSEEEESNGTIKIVHFGVV